MVATREPPLTGIGLYTPQEAACFAKLRPQTFNRWFYGDGQGDPVLHPRMGQTGGERIITFWDLIQAVAIRTLRASPKAARLRLQDIRDVVAECEKRKITSPLARDHSLYCFGNRLVLKTAEGEIIGLTPQIDKNQLYHGMIVEPFLKEVRFGQDKMAKIWTPLKWGEYSISLDAERRFGMPIIEPNGILASTLVDAVESEGSIDAAAEAFEVDSDAVLIALKYQEYLQSAT